MEYSYMELVFRLVPISSVKLYFIECTFHQRISISFGAYFNFISEILFLLMFDVTKYLTVQLLSRQKYR